MRFIRTLSAALIATLVLFMVITGTAAAEDATDRPTPMYWRDVTVRVGRLTAGVPQVNVRSGPGTEYEKIGRLGPEDEVRVTGRYSRDWYVVTFDGRPGYVAAEYLDVTEQSDQAPGYEGENIAIESGEINVPYIFKEDETVSLTGTVRTTQPIMEASVSVFDLRALETVMDATESYAPTDDRRAIDLADFASKMDMTGLNGGEKRLVVTLAGRNGAKAALTRDFYVTGDYDVVANMTADCGVTGRYVVPADLNDGRYNTYWPPTEQTDLTVTLPQGRVGALFAIEWGTPPVSFTLTMYDGDGQTVQTVDEQNGAGMMVFTYALDERTRKITMHTDHRGKRIAEIRVIEKDRVSPALMQWQPLPEKVDILVVSSHQDDELLFLGGTIPYYAAQGKTVAVCYVITCSRSRIQEALEGLWSCGLRYHPITMGYRDIYASSMEEVLEAWNGDALGDMIALIRRYKPEVVVTQDVNGEYGHVQHRLVSKIVRDAVDNAGDASQYPESAGTYGAWDVKKTYIHLYPEHQIHMDCYDEPQPALGGLSALQAATVGYAKHYSQHGHYQMDNQGVKYDNKLFGLYRTTVGYDEAGGDFFENID